MYTKLKVIHVIGVVLFFGSIISHVVASVVTGITTNPQLFMIGREIIEAETYYMTIPGIILFASSGFAMMVKRGKTVLKAKWLVVHAVLGLLVTLNGLLILTPVGEEIISSAQNLGADPNAGLLVESLKAKEATFGAINLISSLVLVILAITKPGMGGK